MCILFLHLNQIPDLKIGLKIGSGLKNGIHIAKLGLFPTDGKLELKRKINESWDYFGQIFQKNNIIFPSSILFPFSQKSKLRNSPLPQTKTFSLQKSNTEIVSHFYHSPVNLNRRPNILVIKEVASVGSVLLTQSLMHQVSFQPKAVPFFSPSPANYQVPVLKYSSPMGALNIRCFSRHFSVTTQHLQTVPLPRPMETHLWYVVPDEVKCTSLLNQYFELLSPSEKQSVSSLHTDDRRKEALLARALVRTTIARYQTDCNIDPRYLKFKKNSYGKPEVDWQNVPNPPPLHFNISHTSSLIACGVTAYAPIGIDVEEKSRTMKNNIMSFARRFFCTHEVEHLANILDHEVQRQEFLKLWTLKEAYVKALGRGFSAAPFNSFRINIGAPSVRVLDVADEITNDAVSEVSEIAVESIDYPSCNWQFALLDLADSHYAAICTENRSSITEDVSPVALRVWKTVPFLKDFCMSKTSSVVTIGGFVREL